MFTLPDLPYAYNALEPHVDEETMRIHHDKHHKAYIDKLNAAIEKFPEMAKKPIEEILADLEQVPAEIRTAVRNHGGGFYHHNLFWNMMSPDGGGEPRERLAEAIKQTFGDFESFKAQFSQAAIGVFGSGWLWLVKNEKGELSLFTTPNQDSPISKGLKPVLGIDVWEHAYYLKYQNRRPDFVEAWWNVVNWKEAERLFIA